MPTFQNTLSVPSSHLPTKMEQIGCSETLAYKIQTPGNYPEESIQHSEHGKVSNQEWKLLVLCDKKPFLPVHNLAVTGGDSQLTVEMPC